VLPYIKVISNKIDQAHFISVVANRLSVSEDAVREEVEKIPESESAEYDAGLEEKEPKTQKISSIENKVAGILLWQKSLDNPFVDVDSVLKDLERIVGKKKVENLMSMNLDIEKLLFEAERVNIDSEKLKNDLNELICNLEEEYIKDQRNKILEELKSAEKEKDTGKITEKMRIYKKLSDKLSAIHT